MTDAQDLTPDDAQAALQRLPLDDALLTALMDPAHPGHKVANTYRQGLYAAANTSAETAAADGMPGGDEASGERESMQPPAHFAPPERPEDYRLDHTPDDLQHDTELEQKARAWFHSAGVPQWLARNVVQEWNRLAGQPPSPRDIENQAVATEQTLRRAWGDRYEEKIAKAGKLIDAVDSDELEALLDRSGLANSEYLIRQLVAIAEQQVRNRGGGKDA